MVILNRFLNDDFIVNLFDRCLIYIIIFKYQIT